MKGDVRNGEELLVNRLKGIHTLLKLKVLIWKLSLPIQLSDLPSNPIEPRLYGMPRTLVASAETVPFHRQSRAVP